MRRKESRVIILIPPMPTDERSRADKFNGHRAQFESNKKRILATQDICGICGKPVDKSLKYPHPLSPTVDHIIPLAKGGHPSDLTNLQLAHFCCNRQKSDRVGENIPGVKVPKVISNRLLPLTFDWKTV
jgi:5-methylcytosine-specific restriction endonuclease McrA